MMQRSIYTFFIFSILISQNNQTITFSKDIGPALGDVMRGMAEAAKTVIPVLSEIFQCSQFGNVYKYCK